jgi:hypothetical protein
MPERSSRCGEPMAPGAEDDLAPRLQAAGRAALGGLQLHALHAGAVHPQLVHLHIGQHRQVGALAHRRHKGPVAGQALAVALGQVIDAHAQGRGAVEVGVDRQAQAAAGLHEPARDRVGVARAVHLQRAVLAVQGRVLAQAVAFGAAEVGQHVLPAPAGAAGRGPALVVRGEAPDVDHAVHRAEPPSALPRGQCRLRPFSRACGVDW